MNERILHIFCVKCRMYFDITWLRIFIYKTLYNRVASLIDEKGSNNYFSQNISRKSVNVFIIYLTINCSKFFTSSNNKLITNYLNCFRWEKGNEPPRTAISISLFPQRMLSCLYCIFHTFLMCRSCWNGFILFLEILSFFIFSVHIKCFPLQKMYGTVKDQFGLSAKLHFVIGSIYEV